MSKDSYKNEVDKEVKGLQNFKITWFKDYKCCNLNAMQNTNFETL
jgi:hypothetical protein